MQQRQRKEREDLEQQLEMFQGQVLIEADNLKCLKDNEKDRDDHLKTKIKLNEFIQKGISEKE